MEFALSDATLFWIALSVALLGLGLLLFLREAAPTTDYVLTGTVIAREGNKAYVQTVVPVIGKNLTRGSEITVPVFWSGTAFVSKYKETKS